jgi:hypothetical protein
MKAMLRKHTELDPSYSRQWNIADTL